MENNNPIPENQSQPISQYQSPDLQPTVKKRASLIPVIVAVFVLLVLIGFGYLLNQKELNIFNKKELVQEKNLVTQQSKGKERITYNITFPFVRSGNLYIYKNGKENLIVPKKGELTQEARNGNVFPLISPNGRFIAFGIYDNAKKDGGMGVLREVAKVAIFDLETGDLDITKYEREGISSVYKWNDQNQMELGKTIYDPVLKKQIHEYPLDGNNIYRYKDQKRIEKVDSILYFIDNKTNKRSLLTAAIEVPLIGLDQEERFEGWSPSGRYALVSGYEGDQRNWAVIDTESPNLDGKVVAKVWAGGAGGISVGTQWFFEKGFIVYCQSELFFVDGNKPLRLTSSGGGGCNSEDGFVATSPNGQHAFIRFDDKFELHSIDGSKVVVTEVGSNEQNKIYPDNFIWLNNDYMLLFESNTNNGQDTGIYLYDRKNNTIDKVIDNGYLYDN